MYGDQRVGTCSLCGGDVYGHRGAWMSVMPPPPDRCSSCGAVSRYDVIPMFKPKTWPKVIEPPMSDEFKERIGINTFE